MALSESRRAALKAMSLESVDIRKAYKLQRTFIQLTKQKPISPLYKVWDKEIITDGRKILSRIYEPVQKKRNQLLVFFHGGGWVTETIDTYNHVCANLANGTGCRVLSVEYRLAPEFPFPCGLDDCYAVTSEILRHPWELNVTRGNVVLIGDSAGGNFAAAISMLVRDMEEFNITGQILLYPALYNNHTKNSPFKSVRENGEGYLLTAKHITEYMELYVSDKRDLKNPYVAPLLAESFQNLPSTLIVTAEFDPLRDEGEYYGHLLRKSGCDVEIYRLKDALHGFISLDKDNPQVIKTLDLINRFLDAKIQRTVTD